MRAVTLNLRERSRAPAETKETRALGGKQPRGAACGYLLIVLFGHQHLFRSLGGISHLISPKADMLFHPCCS